MQSSLSNPPKARPFYAAMLRIFPTAIQRRVCCLLLTLCTGGFTLSAQAQDVIYGLTYRYVSPGPGVDYSVYALKSDGSNFTELKTLPPRNSNPIGSLVEGSDGFLYGVTINYDNNGSYGGGLVYKVRRDGADYQVIKIFSVTDSLTPSGSLVRGSDGFLYGMASAFRLNYEYRMGSIYKINNDGSSFTVLKTFSGPDGSGPVGSLIQGKDGFFYGRTNYGGTYGTGTLFKIKPDGTGFSVLRNLTHGNINTATGNLVQGSDGFLYGITSYDTNEQGQVGTIFKIGADGSDFRVISSLNIRQGGLPVGSLVEGSDGFFYGTTMDYYDSGVEEYGYSSMFKVRGDGTDFTVLRRFASVSSTNYNSISGLVQGSDGFFYGALSYDYASSALYKVNSSGSEFSIVQAGSGFSSDLLILPPPATCQATGSILRDGWTNVPGHNIQDIPLNTPPTLSDQLTGFRTPAGYGDNYGQRIRGYICAPDTGSYQFFIQGDDKAELYLSSDADPAHKQKIASAALSWSWTGQPAQQSAAINLVAGKSYYVEALHKEGTGGDVLRIGWRTPGMVTGSEPVIIPGSVLSPFQPLSAPVILEAGSSQISVLIGLKWNARPTETGYVVERATAQGGPYTPIDTTGPQSLDYPFVEYGDESGQPNTTYYYRIYATTAQGATPYSNVVSASTPDVCKGTGTILREVWTNVPGHNIKDIPLNTPPTLSDQLTSFRTEANYGDNYGQRIRGYICAPATGSYRIFVQGDDKAELYLSRDADPIYKYKIAKVTGSWSWSEQADQQSAPMYLVAGKSYYIEALHKEGTGGDVLRIGWRTPWMKVDSEPVIIPGSVLSPFVPQSANAASARSGQEGQLTETELPSQLQAYPNPTTGATTVEFTAAEAGSLSVQLYNLQGQPLQQLFGQEVQAGFTRQQPLDATSLPSGLYLIRLLNGKRVEHHKLLVMH